MPSLENFATHVKINGIPYAKNTINYQGDETVSIYYLGDRDARVLQQNKAIGHYSKWTLDGVPYATASDLKADMDSFFFAFSSGDPYLERSLGLIPGESTFAIAMSNPAVGNTVFTDVWSGGGDMVIPAAAESLEIVSGSSDDALGGSGVEKVTISTLSSDGTQQTPIEIEMNGTTPVAISGTHLFTNSTIATFPVNDRSISAKGDITLRVAGSGATRAVIKTGKTNAFNSHYMVPKGKTVIWVEAASFSPKNEDVKTQSIFRLGLTGFFITGAEATNYQINLVYPFRTMLILPELSILLIQAKSTNTPISFSQVNEFILIDSVMPTVQQQML